MKNYAALTNEAGTICGVIKYKSDKELVFKTRNQIEVFIGESIQHIPDDEIGLECTIAVYETEDRTRNVPLDEFYLTPTSIV